MNKTFKIHEKYSFTRKKTFQQKDNLIDIHVHHTVKIKKKRIAFQIVDDKLNLTKT